MTSGHAPHQVPPRHGWLPVLLVLLVGCGASTSQPSGPTPTSTKHLKGTISEFPIPNSEGSPKAITVGPDGNLWFTEWEANKIGQITNVK